MKKTLISLVAITGLFAATGCMAPGEAEEIGDEVTEAEQVGEAQEALSTTVEPNASCPPVGTCQKASDLCIPGDPTRQSWCDILGQCTDCGFDGARALQPEAVEAARLIEANASCPPVGTCQKASDLCIPGDPTRQSWCDILGQCTDCGFDGL